MSNFYLLLIPIAIGLVIGIALASYPESNTGILTYSKLLEGGSPIMGDPNAPITILEWGDYQCTFCYKFHQSTLATIQDDHIDTGKVKLVFKDFPLNGPDSFLAAEASFCAEEQEKYWQYHDELYKNWGGERTGWITRESLDKFANTVNLDLEQFNKCLDEHKYQTKVISLHEFGKEIGIDATPSFLVFSGEKIIKIRGNQPLEVFLKTFDELGLK
ncbi:MAG: DsbA family protein [Nitrosopumilus sp.]|jgi:protein-disulfide isomerase